MNDKKNSLRRTFLSFDHICLFTLRWFSRSFPFEYCCWCACNSCDCFSRVRLHSWESENSRNHNQLQLTLEVSHQILIQEHGSSQTLLPRLFGHLFDCHLWMSRLDRRKRWVTNNCIRYSQLLSQKHRILVECLKMFELMYDPFSHPVLRLKKERKREIHNEALLFSRRSQQRRKTRNPEVVVSFKLARQENGSRKMQFEEKSRWCVSWKEEDTTDSERLLLVKKSTYRLV